MFPRWLLGRDFFDPPNMFLKPDYLKSCGKKKKKEQEMTEDSNIYDPSFQAEAASVEEEIT